MFWSHQIQKTNNRRLIRPEYLYLLLSAASGFLELGAIALAIRAGYPFLLSLCIGMAYQIGSLLKDSFEIKRQYPLYLAASGLIASFFVFQNIVLLIVTVFAFSVALQDLRDRALHMSSVGTTAKRLARIVGFSSAGFFSWESLVIIGIMLLISALLLLNSSVKRVRRDLSFLQRMKVGKISLTMLFHQSQYFCYAYTVPFVFINIHSLLGFRFAIAYAIGWVSYTFAFRFFDKRVPLRSLSAGHVLIAVSLVVMYVFSNNLWIFLAGSIFTGLGGGTVFCLKLLQFRWKEEWVDMTLWEDFGHVLGLLIAILIVLIGVSPLLTLLGGAILALITVLIAVIANYLSISDKSDFTALD